MLLKQIIENANLRMKQAYSLLDDNYFNGKDASSYLFNNVVKIAARSVPLDIPLEDVIGRNTHANAISMYFGVPWCEKICSFCNFAYSTSQSEDVHASYIANLKKELEIFHASASPTHRVASVYFGGGTPTLLKPARLQSYVESVLQAVNLAERKSITCEFSTSTVTPEKLKLLQASGITRISTGLQSLDDGTRQRANLVGTGSEALAAVRSVQEVFDNFNIDLIYGHPYQTDEDWFNTVSTVAELKIPSITLYRLEIKDRTTFKKTFSRESAAFADELNARRHYFIAREILEAHGYMESPLGWWIQRNTLNVATNWQTHLQNWRQAMPYFGFGQGAFSIVAGSYYENHSNPSSWKNTINEGKLPVAKAVRLSDIDQDLNQFMRLLRVAKSINLNDLFENSPLAARRSELTGFFISQTTAGLMTRDDTTYHLTEAGESLIHWLFDDMIETLYPRYIELNQ